MRKPGFAIVGCGHIAKRHLRQIISFGTLVAVCDTDSEKAKQFAKPYLTPFFSSLNDLLTARLEVDVMVICTPNGLHAEQAILCLKNGFHVLVEKPLALNEYDAWQVVQTAKEYDRHVFTVLQNRFNEPVQKVYAAIQNGSLGRLFTVQVNCFWNRDQAYYQHPWHGNKQLDGGTLFTQFSHFIDLLLWYFGPVSEINAFMNNANHNYTQLKEDEGAVLLRFENGMIGTIQFSTNAYRKNMEGSVTILAEKGTIKIGGAYLNEIVYEESEEPMNAGITNIDASLQKVYQSMIGTLHRAEKYYADVQESVHTISLIERIYSSIK